VIQIAPKIGISPKRICSEHTEIPEPFFGVGVEIISQLNASLGTSSTGIAFLMAFCERPLACSYPYPVKPIFFFHFILAFSLVALVGCGNFKSRFRHTAPNEIHGSWEKSVNEGVQYTHITSEALLNDAPALIDSSPSDVHDFCPAYYLLDRNGRIAFWVGLISAMTDRESSFDTHSQFTENMLDSEGKKVISRGLMQLSVESARSYGCSIGTESDLEDAETNLRCGVKILNQLILADSSIAGFKQRWLGGARYWSVLRPGGPQTKILATTRGLSVCRLD
jgi:hypothetical protein